MLIRPYRAEDWDALWAVLEPVFRSGETYAVRRDISAGDARAIWTDRSRHVFVAVDETTGEIVGTYYLRTNFDGPGSHVSNCGYVVSQDASGRGVASRMCEHSQAEAIARGYRAMQFNFVVSTNERAVRLWKKQGFRIVGTVPGGFQHPRLGFVDVYVMFKRLAGAREQARVTTARTHAGDVTIREADLTDPADGSALVAVLDSYASDEIGGGRPLAPDVKDRLPEALRDHATAFVLLAFVGGRAAGIAVCFFGFSTFQARPLLNIHDLAVVPDRRGQGIGRALLAAVEEEATRRGCCKLTLEVLDSNQQARRLYGTFGFVDFMVGGSPMRFLFKPLASAGPD
jgi:ribosomal protein S18 acetylase RimI-like enzyme